MHGCGTKKFPLTYLALRFMGENSRQPEIAPAPNQKRHQLETISRDQAGALKGTDMSRIARSAPRSKGQISIEIRMQSGVWRIAIHQTGGRLEIVIRPPPQ